MAILAIHPGDLHLRAAFMGPLDAPALVEDPVEPARFVTPSVATLDVGGPLVGYPALLASAVGRGERVVWRYRRASLADRAVVARDRDESGLTSEAFLALAAGRLLADARGYSSASPELAFTLPQEIDDTVRARIAACVADAVQRPVRVIGEDEALLAAAEARSAGVWLLASVDDDALRLRLVSRRDGALVRLAHAEMPAAGLAAVRARWRGAWNEQTAALVPGAQGYDADGYEFERVWQDIADSLDADAEPSRTLTWPLLRQSTVLTMCAHAASLLQDMRDAVAGVAERAASLCRDAAQVPEGIVLAGPAALRRLLLPDLHARVGVPADRCRSLGVDAYARGAALLASQGAGQVCAETAEAAHALGVVGLGEDGAATVRTLVQPGQPLPAAAQFTIVADRDTQKDVSVTLTRSASAADAAYRFAFGPLVGSGPQRIGIAVEWRVDGRIDARAIDRETGTPIACIDRIELSGGVPLIAASRLRCI